MDARIVDLQTLFGKPVSYRIPQFQRPYAWKRDDQWIPLWDDVRNIAEHWLGLNPGEKMRPHFMGAIVLQRQSNNSAEVERRLVVDGQQRLTTLQLLMRATQEAFAKAGESKERTFESAFVMAVSNTKRKTATGQNDGETAAQNITHKGAAGSTTDSEFDPPTPTNTVEKANPKRRTRKASKPAAGDEAPTKSNHGRTSTSKNPSLSREQRKAAGLCVSCPNQAIQGQTRCPACAEKHLQWYRSKRAEKNAGAAGPSQQAGRSRKTAGARAEQEREARVQAEAERNAAEARIRELEADLQRLSEG